MNETLERIKLFVFAGLLLALPFSKALLSIFTIAFCLVGVVGLFIGHQSKRPPTALLWLPVIYFGWHAVGMLWTTNYSFGWQDLNVKLPFLLLPLLLVSYRDVISHQWQILTRIFILGLGLALLYCLICSGVLYYSSGKISEFFYTSFSKLLHPSYFAWFIDFAIILLFLDRSDSSNKLSISVLLLVVYLSVGVLLLNSKAGIIGWMLSVALVFVWKSYSSRSIRPLLTGSVWVVGFFLASKFLVPDSVNRMETMRKVVSATKDNRGEAESSSTRLQVWHQTIRLIKEQPLLGTGTGDIKDVLVAAYEKANMSFAAERRFNTHNQFLQSWLTLGVIGALIFVLLLFLPLRMAFINRDPALFVFIVLAAFNMMVEAMLEKQAGALYFSLFYSVFLYRTFQVKSTP